MQFPGYHLRQLVLCEDLEAEFENLSKIYNQPAENVKNMFTQRGQVGLVKRNILMEKVAAFLLENAKIG